MPSSDDGVDFLLWDFGDTLADERWCWTSPPEVPQWTDAWRTFAETDLCARWGRGDADGGEVATHLAGATGMSLDAVRTHMNERCRNIAFYERTWAIARARMKLQAIVTVNPVEFRSVIVPAYDLEDVFDVIVVSGEEHTDDKAELCARALERVGITERARSLLIDNIEVNVQSWRAVGGLGCWFRSDEAFADRFITRGWDGLSSSTT
jgi:FMN phosphatase YigB (HAD superfamily)